MSGRFTYNSINVDFERGWSNFQIEKINNQAVNESLSGLTETLEFYNRDMIHLERNYLTGTEIEQLRKWWEYVRDGSSFTLYRDRDFGFEADFAGKSLTECNGNSPTFTRTGTANVVDSDTGLLTSVAENTARFGDGNFNRALLIENSMENFITTPHDTNNVAWIKSNCTATAPGSVDEPSPTGAANECSSIVSSGGSGISYVRHDTGETIADNEDVCFSVWLKAKKGNPYVTMKIYAQTNATALASEYFQITNEWQKYSVTYDNENNDTDDDWRVYYEWTYDTSQTIYHDGAQLEKNQYPTTFFNGTRNAESCYYTLNSTNFNQTQWSISFWIKHPWAYDVGTPRYFLNLTKDSSTRGIFSVNSSNNFYFDYFNSGGISIGSEAVSASSLSADTWQHLAITCDTTVSNGLKIYLNGSLIGTSSNNSGLPDIPNRLYIGHEKTPEDYADSFFDDIVLYKSVLTASEIKAIYNKSHSLGYGKNYWSSVKIANPSFNPVRQIGGKWSFSTDFIEVLT